MIRQLMQTTLHPTVKNPALSDVTLTVAKFGAAAEIGAQAAAFSGCGLDLYGGECVLAGVRFQDEPKTFVHISAAALTNRRTIVGGYSSAKGDLNQQGFAVPHDELMNVEVKDSLLKVDLTLQSARGANSMSLVYSYCKDLAAVYRALLSQPAGARGELPTTPVTPTADDPAGARGAAEAMWSQDGQAYELLMRIDARVREGSMSAADGSDFVARTVLWHRSRLSGPACYGGAYLSPLCADDFANVLTSALGQAAGYQQLESGMHMVDFRIDPRQDALSPALSALGVASYLGLGVGFSPAGMIVAKMLEKPPLTAVRVVYGDVQGGCSYEMYANGQTRLEAAEAMTAHGIHQLLVHSAQPLLARRIEVGWDLRYAELFA